MSRSTASLLFKAAARSDTDLRRLQRILEQTPPPKPVDGDAPPTLLDGQRRIVE